MLNRHKRIIVVVLFTILLLGLKFGDSLIFKSLFICNDKINSNEHSSELHTPEVDLNFFQMEKISKRFSNVPHKLLGKRTAESDKNCAQLPELKNIMFNNIYWQIFHLYSHTLFLFSAYYDNRPQIKGNPVIRIIAMLSGIRSKRKMYCQVWYDEGSRLVISGVSAITLGYLKSDYHPYLLTCHIPQNESILVPVAVSIVEHPCDKATNLLRVVHNLPQGEKKDFAVCVKGLDFPYYDMSKFLVEWIEILTILGVDKIFLYEFNIHPNISKVLEYYKALDMIEVIPLTLPGFQPNLYDLLHSYLAQFPFVQFEQEVLPYNDCFYMNMYRYKYIAIIDTDEVIMPRKHNSWKDIINYLNSTNNSIKFDKPNYYSFKNIISLDSMREEYGWDPTIPKHMHMLQNIYRSATYDKNTKSIIDTARVIKVSNHYPTACEGRCLKQSVPTNVAHVWHYRSSCKKQHEFACTNVVRDTEIQRFKIELIDRVDKTLRLLHLI